MHFILTMLMVVLSNWLTRNPNNTKIVNGKSHLVGTGEAIVKMLKEYSMVKDTLETYTNWDKVPTNLKTKTSLKEMGLRPNGVPVGTNIGNMVDEVAHGIYTMLLTRLHYHQSVFV